MGIAVCVRCGAFKASPFVVCPHCNFNPRGDRRAMAQSLMLSDAYYDQEVDRKPSKQELEDASRRIESGAPIEWNEQVLADLAREQEILEREGSPSWFRIVVLLVVLFLVPLLALVVLILRRLM
jgi:hypothetical protein